MFKFYANRISTKSISLEEAAAKAKGAKQAPDLDTILAEIDAKNKAVKVAAQAPQVVKTASTSAAPTEAAAPAAPAVQVKVAEMPDFIKKKIEEKEGKGGDDKAEKKPFEEKKDEKKEEKEACGTCASKKPVSFKMARKLDFRAWPAEDVVKAWGQHGTMDKCMANVGSMASDAKLYCGLLQVASQEAGKVIKAAAAKAAPQTKTAGTFKKVAAMTEKEKSFLKEYYTKLYGQAYVDALLENY